jgi:hypothetical protein
MKKFLFAVLSFTIIASCTPDPSPSCTSTSGTEICFDGKTYHFDDVFWEKISDHIEIQLEPDVNGPGDYAGIYFFLYGTTIQTDTLPHTGTYTSIPFASPSAGTMDFSGYFQTISGGSMVTYSYEQDASNTLTITAFTGNQVSGNGTYKVRNLNTNEVKPVIFSFENIPFKP